MNDNKKPAVENAEMSLWARFKNLFSKNWFILLISFLSAIIIWFGVMMSQATANAPRVIRDVPITINLSDQAQTDGIKIFNQSQVTADVSVKGNSLITNRLSAEDFVVTADFAPTSTKVSGTAVQQDVLSLKATKRTTIADYEIASVEPSEITIYFDRNKEITLPVDNEITYSAESGYYAEKPSFSDSNVTISGPESSVNKISRVSAIYAFTDPIRDEKTFSCELTVYGQDDKPITNLDELYISLSHKTVEVTIPVYATKTVSLEPNFINAPKGFATESRVTVTPKTIDIVGTVEALAEIDKITLDTPINFADVNAANYVFDIDIPVPSTVRNISGAETAKVEINLNGYSEVKVTTTNIKAINVPAGKTAKEMTTSMQVTIVGSEAQIAKLTGESVSITVDMSGRGGSTGSFELPAVVSIDGANSCWAYGKYTVNVMVTDAANETITMNINPSTSPSSEVSGDVATPND